MTRVRRWLTVAVVLGLVVGMVVAAVWSLQRSLIYFPDTSAVPPAGEAVPDARDVTLHTGDGLELGAWFVPPATEADRGMAVLVAPGNAGHRAGRADLAVELRRRGFGVLLMDYRGYGGNPGDPGEGGLAADAVAAGEALESLGYPPDRVIYLGESLGTGVVAALQERRPPAGVLLRSPFTRLADVGRHHYPFLPVGWLLRDRFEVLERVRRSDVPMTVAYGDRDGVVPTALSAEVAAAVPRLVEEIVIEGAGHNDPVMFGPRIAEAVVRLAEAS